MGSSQKGGSGVKEGNNKGSLSPLSITARSSSSGLQNGAPKSDVRTGSVETKGLLDSVTARALKSGGNMRQSKNAGDDELTVFIGIKIGAGPRGVRFSEIRQTWLEDALAVDDRVRIRFFSRADQDEGGISDVPASEAALPRHLKRRGAESGIASLRSLLVPANCERGKLTCMTSAMFEYYLQHHANGTRPMASYFCNFDDDQYVLVPNLLKVLDSYSRKPPWQGRNLYIGNSPSGFKKKKYQGVAIGGNDRIKFLTGGAGYCLSRDLVEQGADHFQSLPSLPDDVAVGQVVQYELGVKDPVVDVRFHSHLISDPTKEIPLEELSKQVAFGYNSKSVSDEKALERFPNITVLFPHEEDPLRFRSLRCFLQKDASGKYPPDCIAPAKQ